MNNDVLKTDYKNDLKNDKIWSLSFTAICISYFSLFVTFSAYITTLAAFVVSELNESKSQAGLIITVFLIGSVVMRPFSGKWVDMYNKKKILVTALVFFFIFSLLHIPIRNLELMLVMRFFHGMAFGLCSTAMSAIAADLVPAKRKGEGLGYFNMFLSISIIVGPYIALSIVNKYNFNVMFVVCAGFSLLALVCGCIVHKPKYLIAEEAAAKAALLAASEEAARSPVKPIKASALKAFKIDTSTLFDTKTVPIAVSAALLAFAYAGIMTFVSLYAKSIDFPIAAKYYFVLYGITVIFSRPLGGRIFDRFGENLAVYPFIVVFAAGLIVLSTAFGTMSFIATGILVGFGFGTLFSTLLTIALASTPASRRGVASSTFFMFYDSFTGVGSSILGMAAAGIGYRAMYAASISFVVIAAIVFYFFRHKKAKSV
ncbi:MAG: MFS transporter [Clostridiales bacterium]|nr:MFS transporter [Clostridiales bacterium]